MNKLHMIGNSHIDPVWFWDKSEGMQAVKATFRSALDRMNEYEGFTFTASSAQFYEWIEAIDPDMLCEIQQRVKEGRWFFVGGWMIEPDLNLPCGEAFARQGLYGQRTFKRLFGKTTPIGFCVDSFGHNHNLPQLLKKAGMGYYVHMRPMMNGWPPYFTWQAKDGSQVTVLRLMGEYTTWFDEKLKINIDETLDVIDKYEEFPCFFGVGNHGGGPTKANIEGLLRFKETYSDRAEMCFSDLETAFRGIKGESPVLQGELQKCNVGCYSIQSDLKKLNRQAENTALRAEKLCAMAAMVTDKSSRNADCFKEIWKAILFNHFHDMITGTSVQEACQQAAWDYGKAISLSKDLETKAMQHMAAEMDTNGQGFPLLVFNPHGYPINTVAEVETEWFCKDELVLRDEEGNEIPYQRIRAATTMIHMNLAGRRRFLFDVQLPAFGFKCYRLGNTARQIETVGFATQGAKEPRNTTLENAFTRCEFDEKTGMLSSLVDKATGYDLIHAPGQYRVFRDEKDAWGGGQDILAFEGEAMTLEKIEKVEEGTHRQTVRCIYTYQNSRLIQLYHLYKDAKEIEIANILRWNEERTRLKFTYRLNADKTARAEMPYGFIDRAALEVDDGFMQRFIDVFGTEGRGGLFVNDGKYAYCIDSGSLDLTILRSVVYAQGTTAVPWYREHETYRYTDMGEQAFTLAIRPHGEVLAPYEAFRLADKLNMPYTYLADTWHKGPKPFKSASLIQLDVGNVMMTVLKQPEEGDGLILRLFETDGVKTCAGLTLAGQLFDLTFEPAEIKTLRFINDALIKCDFLEEESL